MNRIVLVLLACLVSCAQGAPGVVVRLVTEPPGSTCTRGGVAVLSGPDANGNGVLDDAEIDPTQTQVVCNGEPTLQGLDSLVTSTPEPAGPNCRFGGVRVDTGFDVNGDGLLQTSEIRQTTYVCDTDPLAGVHVGNVDIDSADDLAQLQNVRVIAGDLRLRAPFGTKLVLPALEHIGGDLLLDGDAAGHGGVASDVTGLSLVSLPKLVSVVNLMVRAQTELTTLELPSLTSAKLVHVEGTPALTKLNLGSFTGSAESTFELTGADALTALSMPALTDVVALRISNNRALASLDVGNLESVRDDLTIAGNAALSRCTAGRLWVNLSTRPPHVNLSGDMDRTCGQSDLCALLPMPEIANGKVFQCIDQGAYAKQESGCAGLGGYLLWFESAAEWTAVKARFVSRQLPEAWIGYSDAASEGQWRPTSGYSGYTPVTSGGFWAPGEPRNTGGSEDCAVAGSAGVWASDCASERARVCRVPTH